MAQGTKITAQRRPKGMGSLSRVPDTKDTWLWRTTVTDPVTGTSKRKDYHLHAKTKSEANNIVVQRLAEMRTEDPENPTMDKVFFTWLETIDTEDYSIKHIHESQRIYNRVWRPKLGHKKVKDIKVTDINSVIASKRSSRSSKTLRKWMSALSSPLNRAVNDGFIEFNPCRRVSLGKVTSSPIDLMTVGEGKAIIAYIHERNEVVAEVCRILRMSGMRRGEVCALKWSAVQVKGPQPHILVFRGVEQIGGLVATKDKTKSDAGYRRIPLSPTLAESFKEWRAKRERFAVDHEMELMPNAFVFSLLPDGSEPVKPDLVTKWVGKASDALVEEGILTRHCHPHMWRHAVPSILLAEGWDVKNVQQLMGHASAAMTLNVYASAIPDHEKMAASLDALGQDG